MHPTLFSILSMLLRRGEMKTCHIGLHRSETIFGIAVQSLVVVQRTSRYTIASVITMFTLQVRQKSLVV